MTNIKFQIVIPTMGNRSQYLYWTLRTCLEQDYKDFEILVSNNGGSNTVCDIVAQFNDPRIRYIETKSLLPMAVHWEFAIAHSEGDVITIIGDDDAIMPYTLKKLNDIFLQQENIECITHQPGQYYWPDFHNDSYKNRYKIGQYSGNIKIMNAQSVFKSVAEFRQFYGTLPLLYHGFVKKTVLDHIIKSRGKIFKRISPDIYSDMVLALTIKQYIHIDDCLTIGGQGEKSNGVNFLLNNELGKQFLLNLPDYLTPKYYAGNVNIQVYEYIEMVRKEFSCKDSLNVAWLRFNKQVIIEALKNPAHCQNSLQEMKQIVVSKFPPLKREIALILIIFLRWGLINRFLAKIVLKYKNRKIKNWPNASEIYDIKNIYDLVNHVSFKNKSTHEIKKNN